MALRRALDTLRKASQASHWRTSIRFTSQIPTADDPGGDVAAYQRTAVNIINTEESEGVLVDAYSELGFLLNSGVRVIGPMALFPRSVLHWNIRGVQDVNEQSLSLFYLLEPRIDILVLGVGDRGNQINPQIFSFIKSKGINLEVLPTDQACSTFNFLNSEKRYVAAALIPPHYVPLYEDEGILIEGNKDPFLASDWMDDSDGDRMLEFMQNRPGVREHLSNMGEKMGGFGLGDGPDLLKDPVEPTETEQKKSAPTSKLKTPVPGSVNKTD